MSRNDLAACLLVGTIALMVLTGHAHATTWTFDVAVDQEVPKTLNLVVDDHVVIHFSVVGQQYEDVLVFRLTDPDGNVLANETTGDYEYRFVCNKDGGFVMLFSNVNFTESKNVFLNYEVEHYVFGMPQMLFLTLVIVVLCVAAVAVFIFMGKPH